ncbi:hypothetical protein E6R60_06065 [Streptomyces sp. A0642]|nr:hypothetical protein E6R60_06065 [Streptomyces sp. A0642]
MRATTPRSLRPRAGGTPQARHRVGEAPAPDDMPPRPRPSLPPCVYASTETADTVSGPAPTRAWWDVDVAEKATRP